MFSSKVSIHNNTCHKHCKFVGLAYIKYEITNNFFELHFDCNFCNWHTQFSQEQYFVYVRKCKYFCGFVVCFICNIQHIKLSFNPIAVIFD
jgi:hypothetical protein